MRSMAAVELVNILEQDFVDSQHQTDDQHHTAVAKRILAGANKNDLVNMVPILGDAIADVIPDQYIQEMIPHYVKEYVASRDRSVGVRLVDFAAHRKGNLTKIAAALHAQAHAEGFRIKYAVDPAESFHTLVTELKEKGKRPKVFGKQQAKVAGCG